MCGSVASLIVGLTWGGIIYEWSDTRVIAPIIIGGISLLFLVPLELRVFKYPCFPKAIFVSKTAYLCYVVCFFHGTFSMAPFLLQSNFLSVYDGSLTYPGSN